MLKKANKRKGDMRLEALNPPANMGAMVGGGASGATSRLTSNTKLISEEAENEKDLQDQLNGNNLDDIYFGFILCDKTW
jgi:hypothetical protein